MKLGAVASKVLIFLFDYHQEHGKLPSSLTTHRGLKITNRGHIVLAYQKLEKFGIIARNGSSRWSDGWITEMGQYAARIEKVFPHTHLGEYRKRSVVASKKVMDERRTVFPKTVIPPEETVLMPGMYNNKLGLKVTKGRWKGMYLYSLTLQERATCPTYCQMWATCYGNNMPWAKRYDTTKDFLETLRRNVARLVFKHENGFVIRLHVLGDFYSTEYVSFWEKMIRSYKELHLFGYTAHRYRSDIGHEIGYLNHVFPEQVRIRFSGMNGDATVRERDESVPVDAFPCPEQIGRTESCGTCAACWESKKEVSFLKH